MKKNNKFIQMITGVNPIALPLQCLRSGAVLVYYLFRLTFAILKLFKCNGFITTIDKSFNLARKEGILGIKKGLVYILHLGVISKPNRISPLVYFLLKLFKHYNFTTIITKTVSLAKQEGFSGIQRRLAYASQLELTSKLDEDRFDYTKWVRCYDLMDDAKRISIRDQMNCMLYKPKISVIMPIYNTPIEMLEQAILSVRNQLYTHWELCIADDHSQNPSLRDRIKKYAQEDGRVRFLFRDENGHISHASNSALQLATGEFIALLDHDDLLSEHALFWVAKAINEHPDVGLIYSDEDKVDFKGIRQDPYFKTEWNPALFLSHNLIGHLGVYRAQLVKELGGFRGGFEGVQDYDLALRCIEKLKPEQIVHIPRVLYHWRIHSESYVHSTHAKTHIETNGIRALEEHLTRCGIAAKVEPAEGFYRVRYDLPPSPPLVTLIIPTRNQLHHLKRCIKSILTKTDYQNYEILIVDNGSDDSRTLNYLKKISSIPNIMVLRDDRPFNYSVLNNNAVKKARGSLIGLINNDVEIITPGWLSEMVSLALQPQAGAVGARLWYPNNKLQHAGVILGLGGVAGHAHRNFPRGHEGYRGRASLLSNFSCVTAACLVIRKVIYEQVGGLNEHELKVALNDVDFCLRVREAGYHNIWTPYAQLYHYESASRGLDYTLEKQLRFQQELNYMKTYWGEKLLNDPAYNPNLTLNHEDFSFAWPPRVQQGH